MACVLLCTTATTAEVSSQAKSGYQRLNFTFEKPTKLTVENGANRIVLKFSTPLKKSPGEIAAMTGGYASKASLSPDGRTLTLFTPQRFRTRHFISGNTVGLDIIGGENAPAKVAEARKEKPTEEILTTKKQPKAEEKKAEAKKKAEEKPKTPTKKAEEKPKEELLTTKTEAVKEPPVTKAEAPKPETPSATPEPKKPEEAPAPEVVKEAPTPSAEPPAAVEPAAPHITAPTGPFKVTAQIAATGATIHFPFATRTAAAVFERGNAVWLVFSHAANAEPENLKKSLGKWATEVTQFKYPGNTVLRITTDGKAHAGIAPVKDSYGWQVTLTGEAPSAARDTEVSVDGANDKNRLILATYDVTEPLRFYDPASGGMMLVVPSYEAGLGIKNTRQFPELSLLASAQGIAIAAKREDLSARSTRLGVIVEGPKGLAVSKTVSVLGADGSPAAASSTGVMLPYAAWHVPKERFKETLLLRQRALAQSTKDNRAENMLALATLYLSEGMGQEAGGYLDLLELNEPDFYKARKLALLNTAAAALQHHTEDAVAALNVPELADLPEAALWREYLTMKTPKAGALQLLEQDKPASTNPPVDPATDIESAGAETTTSNAVAAAASPQDPAQNNGAPASAPPMMRFLKYNMSYIRFYPPRIRQLLAADAADAYIANGLEAKAISAFDTLTRDNILSPLEYRAEYAVALDTIKQKKDKEGIEMLKQISAQNADPEMKARARVAHAMLLLSTGAQTPEQTADALEQARMSWRGDALERDVLKTLTGIYKNNKQYDEALRAYKTLVDAFPDDPDFITNSTAMADLFSQLYGDGLADEMPPLKSLSLFYEFRDLTPIGDRGDAMIQKLADRLAAFDLLDRAAQLLENQVTYRVAGEDRSRIGARLSLLYILNKQPEEALRVLEITNFGGNAPELQRQRMQLAAQALSGQSRYEEALNMITGDTSADGSLLKLDILWAAQDWPNVVNTAEDILAKRADLTAPLTAQETEVLMKLALGYSFEGDYTQLRYLRDYYASLLPDSAYKQIFDYLSNDTAPLDREDTTMLSEQISRTEGFLTTFKDKIAAGKLSEAIK